MMHILRLNFKLSSLLDIFNPDSHVLKAPFDHVNRTSCLLTKNLYVSLIRIVFNCLYGSDLIADIIRIQAILNALK